MTTYCWIVSTQWTLKRLNVTVWQRAKASHVDAR